MCLRAGTQPRLMGRRSAVRLTSPCDVAAENPSTTRQIFSNSPLLIAVYNHARAYRH
jgi:hypothetical protein